MTRTLGTLWSVGHYLSWRELRFQLVDPPDRARLICVYGLAGPTWPAFQVHAGRILDGVGREPEFIVDQWERIDWWTHPRMTLDGASVADVVRAGGDFDEIAALVGERG
jgi:hypothetical protein